MLSNLTNAISGAVSYVVPSEKTLQSVGTMLGNLVAPIAARPYVSAAVALTALSVGGLYFSRKKGGNAPVAAPKPVAATPAPVVSPKKTSFLSKINPFRRSKV